MIGNQNENVQWNAYPTNIYLLEVNNRNTTKKGEIYIPRVNRRNKSVYQNAKQGFSSLYDS